MVFGLTAHHAGAHRGCHAEFGGTFGVGFAHFGVIGQAQVVVQAPVQHLLSPKGHVGTDFSFEFGECEIPVGITHVHTDRASGISRRSKISTIRVCYLILRLCVSVLHKSKNNCRDVQTSRILFVKSSINTYCLSPDKRHWISPPPHPVFPVVVFVVPCISLV